MFIPKKALLVLLPLFIQADAQASGSGRTTRYWDCCKPSCGWTGKLALASGSHPVSTCDANDNPLTNYDAKSGCDGGGAYMCTNQMPWAASDSLAYGFGAVSIAGGNEASWCCACYELTFTSGPVSGKKMIIQATNTGGDLGSNHFDLAMPGGGFGLFNGCTKQWGTPSTGWGAQYGGISSRSQCDNFAPKLKAGCYWRFDWFQNADNPAVSFRQITCPAALTSRSGCVRSGETPTGGDVPTYVSTSPVIRSTTTVARTTTSAGTQRTTTTSANNGGSGGTVPQWGQCGGTGYTGPTTCAAPYTCKVTNQWYSQCL